MSKRSPVAIFLAAATIMATAAISNNVNAAFNLEKALAFEIKPKNWWADG